MTHSAVGPGGAAVPGATMRRIAAPLALATALVRCAPSAPPQAPSTSPPLTVTPLATEDSPLEGEGAKGSGDEERALDSSLVGRVAEGTFGPYRSSSPAGQLALWAAPGEDGSRKWFVATRGLDAPWRAAAAPAVADAPSHVGVVEITPSREGFVVLVSSPSPTGTRLETMTLGRDGELIAAPTTLLHSRSEVLWLDTVRADDQVLALWATHSGGSADLFAAPIEVGGVPKAATPLRTGVYAWQAVWFEESLAVATVEGEAGSPNRKLRLSFFDATGDKLTARELAAHPSLGADIDAAVIGSQLVIAWTQNPPRRLEPTLHAVAVGSDGRPTLPPRPLFEDRGPQRLVQLVAPVSPNQDGFLAWESPGQAPLGQRELWLARLSSRARLSEERAQLIYTGPAERRPELARSPRGLGALTVAPACEAERQPCGGASVPVFVELDEQLRVVGSEPVRLADGGSAAALAWGLDCSQLPCSALAAPAQAPVPVHEVELRPRASRFAPAARAATVVAAPRLHAMRAVASADPLASIATARVDDTTLVTYLTQFDPNTPYRTRSTPAPDGRLAPIRAILRIAPFGPDGQATSEPTVLSYRARSVGGVAMAPAPPDRALVVWSALDTVQPEVFATLVGRGGQRVMQRILTKAPGEVHSVCAVALEDGFLAGWVDARAGHPAAWLGKLTSTLGRGARQREASSEGAPVQHMALLRAGTRVWMALVEGEAHAEQRLTLTELSPSDAEPLGPPRVVTQGKGQGLGPVALAERGEGATLVWGEERGARLRELVLGSGSRGEGEPHTIVELPSPARALSAQCEPGECHAAIDLRPAAGPHLGAVRWVPGSAGVARLLLRRGIAPLDGPGLALGRSALFYADREADKGWLRRLEVEWREPGPEAP